MKILLLEDDEIIAQQIKEYFELFDNIVDWFVNGEELLENSDARNYDILLLDINTPKIDGIEVLEIIREMGINVPAIFITAKSDLEYLKRAYSIGCNDYIKKPFDIEELEVRIEYIVNHSNSIVKLGDGYNYDMKKERLFKDDREVTLNKKEQSFLYLLVKNAGEITSNEMIKNYVWNDKDVCDNTLRTTIKKLRDKLDSNFIQNLRGIGYKIEA